MKKIMFVCHGNICRSPMAEFMFKDMVKKMGVEDDFLISSSATSSEEVWNGIGNPVYPPALRKLREHGIDASGKRAVQVKKEDYDKFDLFITMESSNSRNLLRIFKEDKENKIIRLLDFCGGGDISDPWYSGDFDRTYLDIKKGLTALLESLIKK
ncbi:MAG: low molecular weight phosphotyrosine protein phosphatase [Clostridiales bacterium]|nr:low molecular weight phosphotyrosine protein phosphatase [Clostridiales bacterium]